MKPGRPKSRPSHPAVPYEGTIVAHRFRLVRRIGEGAAGSVWMATHVDLGLRCAVKLADGEWRRQPGLIQRFECEAKLEAQLRSPHVVRVFDHGTWMRTPYIAMEYLEGESLAARLEREGRLDGAAVQRIVAHVARALTQAHAIGVVHRDLKPENIFLVPEEDGEIVKVLDFGVAKWGPIHAAPSITGAGAFLGTPVYMSPEQARGTEEVDFHTDLWSLAVIAYECLTGELPFASVGIGDLLTKIMYADVPVPSSIVPTLRSGFDEWWAKAASRDVRARHQSAKELADALGPALGLAHPVTVAPAPPGLREAVLDDLEHAAAPAPSGAGSPPRSAAARGVWPVHRLLGAGALAATLLATSTLVPSDPQQDRSINADRVASQSPPIALATAVPPPPNAATPRWAQARRRSALPVDPMVATEPPYAAHGLAR